MNNVATDLERLLAVFQGASRYPPARGASDEDIREIKETFAKMGIPLPDDLLDVYRMTLGLSGVRNAEPILATPCLCPDPTMGLLHYIDADFDDVQEDHALWLGYGNGGCLIIDRDGQCSLAAYRAQDGSAVIEDPTTFAAAFNRFVEIQIADNGQSGTD